MDSEPTPEADVKAAFLSDEGLALVRRIMECDLSTDDGHAEAERLFGRLWALAHPPSLVAGRLVGSALLVDAVEEGGEDG